MKADKFLDQIGINYTEIEQEEPTKGCTEAAEVRGLKTSQIVKSLIIESKGETYHILLPGDRELSEKKFGAEYRMVPPEKAEEITGFEPGTVHPFSTQLKHFADRRIFEKDEISHTVGETKRAVLIESKKFRESLNKSEFKLVVDDFVVSKQSDYEEITSLGLKEEDARFIVDNKYASKFNELSKTCKSGEVLDFFRAIHREGIEFDEDLADEVLERSDNQTHMQKLLETFSSEGELPDENGFELEEKVEKVLEKHEGAFDDLRNGKDSAMNFLIGKLMQETNGKTDPGKARQMIEERI